MDRQVVHYLSPRSTTEIREVPDAWVVTKNPNRRVFDPLRRMAMKWLKRSGFLSQYAETVQVTTFHKKHADRILEHVFNTVRGAQDVCFDQGLVILIGVEQWYEILNLPREQIMGTVNITGSQRLGKHGYTPRIFNVPIIISPLIDGVLALPRRDLQIAA